MSEADIPHLDAPVVMALVAFGSAAFHVMEWYVSFGSSVTRRAGTLPKMDDLSDAQRSSRLDEAVRIHRSMASRCANVYRRAALRSRPMTARAIAAWAR
jgi:hypothetical protein